MKTSYAGGRHVLPTLTASVSTSGPLNLIQGNSVTYYFFIKAANRVGYNSPSAVRTLVLANNSKLTIAASNFASFNYEDWREFIVSISSTNDFSTSRVIAGYKRFKSDGSANAAPTDIVINDTMFITDSGTYATPAELPTVRVPSGYRAYITSLSKTYEYSTDSTLVPNSTTVLAGTGGNWLLVPSNSLIELTSTHRKELFEVSADELITAPLDDGSPSPITYYIENDSGTSLAAAELALNSYVSDLSLQVSFEVEVLGYLNLTTYALDIASIPYVGSTVTYPDNVIRLPKALPNNSALVIKVYVTLAGTGALAEESYVSLYPKLSLYFTGTEVSFYGEPVADIASLKGLASSSYKDKQVRYLESKAALYAYDAESTATDNGDTVIAPNGSPPAGRWLASQAGIQDGTISLAKLDASLQADIAGEVRVTTLTYATSQAVTLNTDLDEYDYFIVNCPADDAGITTVDVTGTLANNSTKNIVVELRQNTGTVVFHSSITFPGGALPVYSGAGKKDIFVITLLRDGSGALSKRGLMSIKDAG